MPFALIPEDFKLQKVTKAQERAVKSKRRHDSLIALIDNPGTVAALGTIVAATLIAPQVDKIIETLKEEGIAVSEDVVEKTKQSVSKTLRLNPLLFPADIGLSLAGKVDADIEKQLREILPFL